MIRLTHFREGHAIYINPTEIVSFQQTRDSYREGTHVYLKDRRYFQVREAPADIAKLIEDSK